MNRYTFGKKDKLCSKLMIDKLFASGKSFKEPPFRVIYQALESCDSTAKLLVTVPKKMVPKAVIRNRIKRQIRESYRLNRQSLMENWQGSGKYFALAFVYTGRETMEYTQLSGSMQRALEKLNSLTS